MSVVLENHFDPKYDPNQNEVEEYGKWLGMELPAHKALLWIAKEGLKAPLPENWKACKSEKGELYYFNFKTGQSMWDHPMDQHYKDLFQREKAKLLAGGNGSAPTSSPPPPNGATTTAATKASSNTGTDSARTSDNDTDHDTKAASTIRVTRKSGKKRESAISFVEGSGAPSAGHLLPAAATSAAPLSHHSSVEVSDEDTSAATTPTTSEAVGTQPQQQQQQQQQPAGLGMGKLAQLKSLKGSAGPKLPPAANSAAPLAATTSTTPAATSATKTLAPLSTHKAPPPAQRDPSPTRASSPFGATLPPSAILPGAAVSAASAVNAAVSAKLDTAGQFEAATKKHQQALQGLKAEQEEEMNQAKAKHSKALAALVEEQNRDLEAARAKHTERMTTTKAHYDAALQEKVKTLEADLEREFANSEAKLRAANGARIAKAAKEIADQSAAKHQQVVEENTKVVKATVSSFASTVSDMVSKLLALETEYTTIFQNHAVNAAVEKARVAATAAAAAETKALEERLRSETLELKGTHADQVQQLASLHAAKVAEMAQLAATTSAQVDTLKAARDKAVAAARQEQDEEVQRIATEHDAALRKLSDEYANAIVAARASHESRLHDVRRELLAEYTAAEQELRRKAAAEYDALVNELGAGQQHGGNSARTSVSRAPSTSVAAPLTDSSQSRADSEEQTLPGGSMVPSSNGNSSGNGGGGSLGNTMRGSKLPGNVAPLVPDHLNPATEQYAPGPLSVSSTNSPAARDGLGGGSNLTGDALRDAIVSVIRALVTEGSLAASTGGSQVAGSISAAPPLQPWPATQYTAATTTAAATAMTADAATFMSPQQTQRALFTKSDEVASSHHAFAAPHPPSGTDGLYHHPFHSATTGYRPTPPSVPHSVVEQKRLLEKERERLEAAKTFLERQMQGLEKQRVALKSARSKWKQDVRLAKASGTSANSRKASMLRNVHSLLDQQADGLAQDEGVLRETQLWLDAKESRLVRLEHLLSAGGDVVSTLSGSAFASHVAAEADTTAMLAAYLEAGPARASPPALAAADRREVQRKPSPFGGSGHSRPPTPAPAASDELLLRIESRLAEVTSLVKGEHRRSSSSRYDSTGYPRSGPNSRSNSTHRRHHRTGSVGFTDPNTGIHAQ